MEIKASMMASAHERAVKAVLDDGVPIETENGEMTTDTLNPCA